MKLESINEKYATAIKITSIVLTSIAIVLEISNIITGGQIANNFSLIIFLGHILLISHFVEGIIAAFYGKNKIKSGIYVFFVGTIGLSELVSEQQLKN